MQFAQLSAISLLSCWVSGAALSVKTNILETKDEVHLSPPPGMSTANTVTASISDEHSSANTKDALEKCLVNGAWPSLVEANGVRKFDLVISWWTDKPQTQTSNSSFANVSSMSLANAGSKMEMQSEIMYALRSYEKNGFLEYVRDIVILVDAEVIEKFGKPRFFDYTKKNIRVVTDEDMGVDNRGCLDCGRWSKWLFMHKIPGLSEYFVWAPDDVFMQSAFHLHAFFDEAQKKPVMYDFGDWKCGWCDHGLEVGSGHGPVLINKCAMQNVAESYSMRGYQAGKTKGRDAIDALCIYSNEVMHDGWLYKDAAKTSESFFEECHTNAGCIIGDMRRDTLFVNVQGTGVSDEYPSLAAGGWRQELKEIGARNDADRFFSQFSVPSRFER